MMSTRLKVASMTFGKYKIAFGRLCVIENANQGYFTNPSWRRNDTGFGCNGYEKRACGFVIE